MFDYKIHKYLNKSTQMLKYWQQILCKFEDLNIDIDDIRTLKRIYSNDVNSLDLYIGCLVEDKIPNSIIGNTTFYILLLMSVRMISCDRFLTEYYNEETYTKEGLEWIENNDLKSIFSRHMPYIYNMSRGNIFNIWR